jgi:hypothetical protein
MHKIMMAVIAAAVAGIAVPNAVQAAACTDAKGKFIKCPPGVVAKPVVKTVAKPVVKHASIVKPPVVTKTAPMAKTGAKPVTKPMVMSSGLTKDKNGRCHYAAGPKKGNFAKCG